MSAHQGVPSRDKTPTRGCSKPLDQTIHPPKPSFAKRRRHHHYRRWRQWYAKGNKTRFTQPVVDHTDHKAIQEVYEPLWDRMLALSEQAGFRIRGIWAADMANQEASGVLNENEIGDDRTNTSLTSDSRPFAYR